MVSRIIGTTLSHVRRQSRNDYTKMRPSLYLPLWLAVIFALIVPLRVFGFSNNKNFLRPAFAFAPFQTGHSFRCRDGGETSTFRSNRCHGCISSSSTELFAEPVIPLLSDESNEGHYFDYNDVKLLEHLVLASSLSYLSSSDGTMQSSPYFSASTESKNNNSPQKLQLLEPLIQVVDPKSESGATIFRSGIGNGNDNESTTIIVACRGSATPINFSTNLKFKLVSLDKNDRITTVCDDNDDDNLFLIHQGFQEASYGLWKLLQQELNSILHREQERDEGRTMSIRLIFTGHSLGAATAQLCAAKYQSSQISCDISSIRIPLSGVVTFGGPRLVNRALAEHWNKNLFCCAALSFKPRSTSTSLTSSPAAGVVVVRNYVHWKDPILRQNGPLWDSLGFGILGKEVLCQHNQPIAYHDDDDDDSNSNGNGNQLESKMEVKNKSNLPLAWNILDHCQYLGVFVGPRLFQ